MRSLIAVGIAGLVSACGTSGSRDCGSFDLPQANEWSTVEAIGEAATFTNDSGESITLELLARDDNEPYRGSDRFGAEEVVCQKTSLRRYAFDQGSTGLVLRFSQAEAFGESFEEQSFFIGLTPEAPSGTALPYGYLFNAGDPVGFYGEGDSEQAGSERVIRVSTDVDIGGDVHALAVELFYADTTEIESLPEGVDIIESVTFAKGTGIVRIGFGNGEVYTRQGRGD